MDLTERISSQISELPISLSNQPLSRRLSKEQQELFDLIISDVARRPRDARPTLNHLREYIQQQIGVKIGEKLISKSINEKEKHLGRHGRTDEANTG